MSKRGKGRKLFMEYYKSITEKYRETVAFLGRKPLLYIIMAMGDDYGVVKKRYAKMVIKEKGVNDLIKLGIVVEHYPDKTVLLKLTSKGEKIYRLLKELHETLSE